MKHLSYRWPRRGTRQLGTLAIVVAVCSALLGAPALGSNPLVASDVFDKNSIGWSYETGMPLAEFQSFFAAETPNHLMLDIEADEIAGQMQYQAVFQDKVDGRGQIILRDITKATFDTRNADEKKRGMRLVDVEIYQKAGAQRYAAIWLGNSENLQHHLTRDMTKDQILDYATQMRRDGYAPIDVQLYEEAGNWRYAAIWLQNPQNLPWALLAGQTEAQYVASHGNLRRNGYRPIDLESTDTGTQIYDSVWVYNSNGRDWLERHDMDQVYFDNYKRRFKDLGYRPIDVEAYTIDGQLRYSMIWRQNSGRPNWEPKTDVDTMIENKIDEFELPGMSVVIMQNGTTLYRRGFDNADIASGRWWDADTTGRLASISKAITGTMAVGLERAAATDGNPATTFNLDDTAEDWVNGIPSGDSYTVGDLASNAACISQTSELTDTSFAGEHYDTALAASQAFWDDETLFFCTPPGNSDHYSTPGYTFLGAALEQATGVDLATMIRQTYSDPLDLPTLRAEDPASAPGRRTTLYEKAGDGTLEETDREDMSWKLGGGGMEASPADLAKWGAALMDGQILDAAGLARLWTAPPNANNYANGWDLEGTELGRQVVSKTGGQEGAKTYIRMYPSEEVVVVVMVNRNSVDPEEHFAKVLGTEIGGTVLTWIDS